MRRHIAKDLRDDRQREIDLAIRIQDRIEAHIRGGPEREAAAFRAWASPGRVVHGKALTWTYGYEVPNDPKYWTIAANLK